MGNIMDALRTPRRREAEAHEIRMRRLPPLRVLDDDAPWPGEDAMAARSYKVVTVASNKGGVGKTTIASNLPVFMGALREDLPVLVIGLDDQSVIDRMFELDLAYDAGGVVEGLREGSFRSHLRVGQYGIHYVPSSAHFEDLAAVVSHTGQLRAALDATDWEGLVVVDTKSDLGLLTRNAIAASDLVVIPVADDPSLREADKLFELMERCEMPRERGRVLLSMIDRRIKFREGEERDILALLLSRIRERGYPLLESFLSRSPKIESLTTNPDGRARSILAAAPGSIVTLQMRHVADELLKWLDRVPVNRPGFSLRRELDTRRLEVLGEKTPEMKAT
jgi:cellulose biosynthesis protein BcsQ